ncbi:macrophage mannose receptor 1-like [Portunus trituberculatus]|uniref:macrophage mannose receptor 1-like n=1 Tax=Portunus trituberculatus TaxID=210409 RepID=UPI001E1CF854|nr:macrophage mannose receptor 1-like [Portunus trituberculatus]
MAASRTLVLLTVLFALALTVAVRETCPDDWLHSWDLCLWVSNSSKTNWEAIEDCKRKESDLVYINSNEENYILAGVMLAMGIDEMWIGLNDIGVNKVYKWSGHQKVVYTNFLPGKAYNRKRHSEDCVSMKNRTDFKWDSEYCFTYLKFICRKDLS